MFQYNAAFFSFICSSNVFLRTVFLDCHCTSVCGRPRKVPYTCRPNLKLCTLVIRKGGQFEMHSVGGLRSLIDGTACNCIVSFIHLIITRMYLFININKLYCSEYLLRTGIWAPTHSQIRQMLTSDVTT